jgi:hypothetical protein
VAQPWELSLSLKIDLIVKVDERNSGDVGIDSPKPQVTKIDTVLQSFVGG